MLVRRWKFKQKDRSTKLQCNVCFLTLVVRCIVLIQRRWKSGWYWNVLRIDVQLYFLSKINFITLHYMLRCSWRKLKYKKSRKLQNILVGTCSILLQFRIFTIFMAFHIVWLSVQPVKPVTYYKLSKCSFPNYTWNLWQIVLIFPFNKRLLTIFWANSLGTSFYS